ncbi:MAG: hypothetical protein PHP23_02050 [Desulfobacterales bacterium]|nr:hypothetical protein [Desulfobacterales bacterium]MDD4070840.1 hypothetical protein [Desulfobacterales bacterium]MDD4391242.1 hypothetical protein [Desulfobacterales bacterium]
MKNSVNFLSRMGLYVSNGAGGKGDKIKIWGLNRLSADQRENVVEYAKEHKTEIIETLNRKNPRCLGIVCDYAQYKEIDEMPFCLWCNRVDKLGLNLAECPEGYWEKDELGFPKNALMEAHSRGHP